MYLRVVEVDEEAPVDEPRPLYQYLAVAEMQSSGDVVF